jgi:hypothetical protein
MMFFRDYKAWRLLLKILETTGTVVIRLYDRNSIALKSWNIAVILYRSTELWPVKGLSREYLNISNISNIT